MVLTHLFCFYEIFLITSLTNSQLRQIFSSTYFHGILNNMPLALINETGEPFVSSVIVKIRFFVFKKAMITCL